MHWCLLPLTCFVYLALVGLMMLALLRAWSVCIASIWWMESLLRVRRKDVPRIWRKVSRSQTKGAKSASKVSQVQLDQSNKPFNHLTSQPSKTSISNTNKANQQTKETEQTKSTESTNKAKHLENHQKTPSTGWSLSSPCKTSIQSQGLHFWRRENHRRSVCFFRLT